MKTHTPTQTHSLTPADNRTTPLNDLHTQAARILSSGWLPTLLPGPADTESPPEDALWLALTTLLWGEVEAGRLEMERHHVIRAPAITTEFYEADVYIHQPGSASHGVIEVSAWQHHAATAEQFEGDLRRTRELQRSGYDVLTYSAREVARSPWSVALDAVRHMAGAWFDFHPIVLPDPVLALARACAAETASATSLPSPAAEPGAVSWHEVQETIASLPSQAAPRDAHEMRVRARWSRAYEPWTDLETQWLRRAREERLSMWRLVEVFRRSPGAIRRALERLGPAPIGTR
jgi:very-short-patch-repair endonuclease